MPTVNLLKGAFIWGAGATVGANLTQGALDLTKATAKKIFRRKNSES